MSQNRPRKVGFVGIVVGLLCLCGLTLLFGNLARSSGWAVLHNQIGVFVAGAISILVAPVWAVSVLVVGASRPGTWGVGELGLIVAVCIMLVMTAAVMT